MSPSFSKLSVLSGMVLLLMSLNLTSAAAQEWKDMEWDQFKIAFKVPDYFEEKSNTEKAYTASGSDFTLSIQPWKDATMTAEDVANKALKKLNATDVTVTSQEKVKLKGFEGYQIIGAGAQKDKAMIFVVLGMIDPEGETNFSAYIMFWHNEDSNDGNIEIATKIIESFSKME